MEATSVAIMIVIVLLVLAGIKKLSQLALLFGSDFFLRIISIILEYIKTKELHFEYLIYSPIQVYDSYLPVNPYLAFAGLGLWLVAIMSSLYDIMGKFIKAEKYRRGMTALLGTLFFFGFGNGLPNLTMMVILPSLMYIANIIASVISEIVATVIAGFLIYTIPRVYKYLFPDEYDEGLEALRIQEEIYKKLGVKYKKIKLEDLSELWTIRGEPFFTKDGIYILVSEDEYQRISKRKRKKNFGEPLDLDRVMRFIKELE